MWIRLRQSASMPLVGATESGTEQTEPSWKQRGNVALWDLRFS